MAFVFGMGIGTFFLVFLVLSMYIRLEKRSYKALDNEIKLKSYLRTQWQQPQVHSETKPLPCLSLSKILHTLSWNSRVEFQIADVNLDMRGFFKLSLEKSLTKKKVRELVKMQEGWLSGVLKNNMLLFKDQKVLFSQNNSSRMKIQTIEHSIQWTLDVWYTGWRIEVDNHNKRSHLFRWLWFYCHSNFSRYQLLFWSFLIKVEL